MRQAFPPRAARMASCCLRESQQQAVLPEDWSRARRPFNVWRVVSKSANVAPPEAFMDIAVLVCFYASK